MKIDIIKVSKPFKYLWLKSIKGVDLSQHCARGLIGEYDSRMSAQIETAKDIELTEQIYYLCGVSKPYVWENNFHLAFRKKEGSTIEVERCGIKVLISDAEEIKFSIADIDKNLPQSRYKEFYTCRNWQFANKIKREVLA